MKTNPFLIPAATALLAGLFSVAQAQPVTPSSGMPTPVGPVSLNPATGRPASSDDILASHDQIATVHKLIASGDYDEALTNCLAYQSQLKGDQTLEPLIPDWVELGRRFPAARDALLKIRDHAVSEFSSGRGYAVRFSEIKAINDWMNEDDSTLALFKSIHQQDRKLSDQCYGAVQDLLVQKGEYALCLECLGDPRSRFESLQNSFEMMVGMQQRQLEMRQFEAEQAKKFNRLLPPAFSPLDQGKMATNNFVAQVLTLEKILAGTGRQADAEIIRDQALGIVADDRFRSTLTSAVPKPAP